MDATWIASLGGSIFGGFVGSAATIRWARKHAVDDRRTDAVLAFNKAHIRLTTALGQLRDLLSTGVPADQVVDDFMAARGLHSDCMTEYVVLELRWGVDSPQRQLAENAHQGAINAQNLLSGAMVPPGPARDARLTEVTESLLDAAQRRKALVNSI